MHHEIAAGSAHDQHDERAAQHCLPIPIRQHERRHRRRGRGHVPGGEREPVLGRGAGEAPPVEEERGRLERPRPRDEVLEHDVRGERAQADGDEHDRPGTSRAFEHHKHEGQREEACALLAYEAHRLEQGREREAPAFCERMQRPQDRRIERGERVVQPRGHQGCFHRTVLSPHGCCGSLAGPSLHETTRASRRQATMRRTGDTVRDLRSRPGVTSAEYGSRRRPSPGAART